MQPPRRGRAIDEGVIAPDLEYFSGQVARFAPTWAAKDMKTSQSNPNEVLPPPLKDDDAIVVFAAQLGPSAQRGGVPLHVTHPTPVGQIDL
jgi:hypothetical protein